MGAHLARTCTVLVACLGLAAFLAGQQVGPEGGRQPHVARVQGVDGKPLAGAEVTFAATEGLGPDGVDDVARAVSDERGRARVDLLRGRDYRAFGVWHDGAVTRVTSAVRRSVTTTEIAFAGANKVSPAREVTGLAAWRGLGPLAFEFVPLGCEALKVRCVIGENDMLEMPPLCGDDLVCRIFLGEHLVRAERFYLRASKLELPPPRAIKLRVVDDADDPVADAVVERVTRADSLTDGPFPGEIAPRFVVATTDAEGRATAWLASREDPFAGVQDFPGIPFVARKAGYRDAWSGFTKAPYCDLETSKAEDLDGTLRFTLQAVPIERVKVLARGEARPERLLVRVENSVPGETGSFYRVCDTASLPLSDGGAFDVPRQRGESVALVVPAVLPPIAGDDPFARCVAPRAMVLPPDAMDENNGIDLRQVQALRLQLVDATAGPARGAAVLCSPRGPKGYVQATGAMRATADAAGRVVFPVIPGQWLVVALLEGAWVQTEIEVAADLDTQTLQLEPLAHADVRVIDGDGDPVADVAFHVSGGGWSSSDDDAVDGFVTDIAHHVNSWLVDRARTDAEGRAQIPMLVCRGVHSDFEVRHGRRLAAKQRLQSDEPIEFVVR